MSSNIVITPRFASDYQNAYEYLVAHTNSSTVVKFEASVINARELIATFPCMYQVVEGFDLSGHNVRICNFETWRILYTIEGEAVYLRRLLHQSQDMVSSG